jgi:hypothetical protein
MRVLLDVVGFGLQSNLADFVQSVQFDGARG